MSDMAPDTPLPTVLHDFLDGNAAHTTNCGSHCRLLGGFSGLPSRKAYRTVSRGDKGNVSGHESNGGDCTPLMRRKLP